MKTQRTDQMKAVRRLSAVLLFGVILTMMLPAGAWAVGTASTTSIDNQASISYDVNTIPQTNILSDGDGNFANGPEATSFVVDNMVDLDVSTLNVAAGPVVVTPDSTYQVVSFQVDNTGNTTQDFLLSAIGQTNGTGPHALPYGGADANLNDDFDGDTAGSRAVRIFVDADGASATSGYTPSTWDGQATESEVSFIDDLAADESITVYITIDISPTQTDGQVAIYGMRAQVAGSAGAPGPAIASDDSAINDDPATVQIVFGDAAGSDDAANDGQASSRAAYRVGSAALTVAKASAVMDDGFNVFPTAKAIPFARVQYTITITNNGSVAADNIIVTDDIPANTWYHVTSGVVGGAATFSNDGGGTYTYGPTAGTYGADVNVDSIQVNVGTIAAGGNATVTFNVIIQ